jgi:hypothetical protein
MHDFFRIVVEIHSLNFVMFKNAIIICRRGKIERLSLRLLKNEPMKTTVLAYSVSHNFVINLIYTRTCVCQLAKLYYAFSSPTRVLAPSPKILHLLGFQASKCGTPSMGMVGESLNVPNGMSLN